MTLASLRIGKRFDRGALLVTLSGTMRKKLRRFLAFLRRTDMRTLLEKIQKGFTVREGKTYFDDNLDPQLIDFRDAVRTCEVSDLDASWETASEYIDFLLDTMEGEELPNEDSLTEQVDNLVPCYNKDRMKWLMQDFNNVDYVDEAVSDGLADLENFSLFNVIGIGIYHQKEIIFNHLQEYFEAVIKNEGEETDE
jgi:hypothetical protein